MRRVHLEAAEDHVQRLARESDALGAVKELIWNALDADAMRVEVILERAGLDVIQRVSVVDNGTGIAPEALQRAFERIGGSWKKRAAGTVKLQRMLHGSSGQGRLRGYALGDHIKWVTIADGIDGRFKTEVSAHSGARNDFEIGDSLPTQEPTGTKFEAWGRQSAHLDKLTKRDNISRLATELAPYLIAYPDVEVIYDGTPIDPQTSIQRTAMYPLSFRTEAGEQSAQLKIIEWSTKVARELHLCDSNGMPIGSIEAGIRAPGFDFTAYVMWEHMSDNLAEVLLGDIHGPDIATLTTLARERLKAHFRSRVNDRRQELVDAWKADGSYPYLGAPRGEAERVERETFDLVATTVHRHIPRNGRQLKTTLTFLREAVRTQPDGVTRLLEEIFKLTTDDIEQLEYLLRRTTLPKIIRASKSVTDRLEFLAILSHMVFDPVVRKLTKERSQLHKILANEAWIFGERHSLLVSDKSLDAVLDRHLSELGRDARSAAPVLREDGTTGIVDLMLSRARREHDRLRHLVVELKAPAVKAGPKELAQIKSYAVAVATDLQFRDKQTDWDFWLITADQEKSVRIEAHQKDREPGCVWDYEEDGARIRVWARTWSEIIEECRDRLHFFREHLAHDPDMAQAIEYLNNTHVTGIIPEPLRLPSQQQPEPVAV
ncbi:ATP-binding protein [Micromonospora humida]|uniref:ATP-binding protein n=1 Tax=Micromonospora humida TaxID=2809018 RepID=UPI0034202C82